VTAASSRRGALALALAAALAFASAPSRAELSDSDRADIARIEAWLQGVETLSARFVQVAPDGAIAEGDFYLRRPGRLRFDYDPPVPLLIVADGFSLTLYDRDLDQPTSWPVAATPLAPLVAKTVDLSGGYAQEVRRNGGVVRLTLVDPGRPDEGSFTLVFQDEPLQLLQWVVIDAAGLATVIGLSEVVENPPLELSLFRIERPEEEEQLEEEEN
jgi:outer membrane lipoprotein-sorting protein